jgi:peptidoglycan/xylan/chitin deacetylase (PgdA/CDA1 family)
MFQREYKKRLFNIAAWALFYSRALRLINHLVGYFQAKKNAHDQIVFPFIQKRRSRSVQILVYHRVNDEYDPFFPAVPVNIFAKQMEYIATHFHCCSLEEAVERIGKNDIRDNTVVITFDDGYKDNYTCAFPILQRLSIPATIFLATDAIDSGKALWHDRVFSAFRETRMPFLDGFGGERRRYPLRTLEEKLSAQTAILRFLRSASDQERTRWIEQLMDKLNVADQTKATDLMLTWSEIKTMHQSGITFGSHTITHPILSKTPTDQARVEIYEPKRIIEEHLRAPVRSFAYPSGRREDFNEVTKYLVQEAGYTCALTMIFGANAGHQDPFELRRITSWDDNICAFGMRLSYYRFVLE